MASERLSDEEMAYAERWATDWQPRDRCRIALDISNMLAEIRALRTGIRRMHAQVDQTAPDDPVGVALTRAGLAQIEASYGLEDAAAVGHFAPQAARLREFAARVSPMPTGLAVGEAVTNERDEPDKLALATQLDELCRNFAPDFLLIGNMCCDEIAAVARMALVGIGLSRQAEPGAGYTFADRAKDIADDACVVKEIDQPSPVANNPTSLGGDVRIVEMGGNAACPEHGARCCGAECCCADKHPRRPTPTPLSSEEVAALEELREHLDSPRHARYTAILDRLIAAAGGAR